MRYINLLVLRNIVLGCIAFCIALPLQAQSRDIQDSISIVNPVPSEVNDTVKWVNIDSAPTIEALEKSVNIFKPNPTKAVIYSAILPGLGQIYNKKYWKLPILYGGFVGLAYAITWNGKNYNDYTDGYKAIVNPNAKQPGYIEKWQNLIPSRLNPEQLSESEMKTWEDFFKRKRNYFRRNRDLSIIGAVALYALCMIDAYVDAQLFDFDISPDLSLKVEPKMETDPFAQKSFGLQCSFKF